jgi:hypothetical protein
LASFAQPGLAQSSPVDACATVQDSATCEDAVVSVTGDAHCKHRGYACVAVSPGGNATCQGPRCVAVSAAGDARGGLVAVAGAGDAECNEDRFGFERCPGVGVSVLGCAEGQIEVDTCEGAEQPDLPETPGVDDLPGPDPERLVPQPGVAQVDPKGDATCSRDVCVAASGTGEARGGVAALSGTSDAKSTIVAASGTGDAEATCGDRCTRAIGGVTLDETRPGFLLEAAFEDPTDLGGIAVSGTGDATTCRNGVNCLSVSGNGTATGWTAISLLGTADSCSQYTNCLAVSGTGPAKGGTAISAIGPAEGGQVAASGTERAEASVVAASATGSADAGTLAVSGCDAAGACLDAAKLPVE